MAESTSKVDYRHRSPFTWLAIFWCAMALPRVWYLCRSGAMFEELSASFLILRIGFLRDGLIVGVMALVLQLLRRPIARRSARFYSRFLSVGLWGMSIVLGLMMVNAEVLHQAGTQLEWQYFHLLTGSSDGPMLFLTERSAILILLLHLVVIPVVFYRLCLNVRLMRLDWFLSSWTGILVSLTILSAGVASLYKRLPDETKSAVANNYLFWLASEATTAADISDTKRADIRRILDPVPLEKPGVAPQPWHFVDPQYPLIKATAHHLCQAGVWSGDQCAQDNDRDGVPVSADCNDWDPRIHPGAVDKPRDGIDSDCSGLDADPPNIIFIHFESARAANFGSVGGFKRHSTPRLDNLVKDGVVFTNAYCNGIQTRYSLVPMYCSTYDRMSNKWICLHYPRTELLSIPGILRGRGYHTIYVHGGDNNFSSHSARLWQWFEDVYDKSRSPFREAKRFNWGLKDKDLFSLTYDILKKRQDKRPFYLAVATLSLHFPMGLPDPRYEFVPGNTYDNTVSNILRYADDALGDFIEKIQADKQFENTIVMVAADHGINGNVPTVLDEEVVWVPILLIGKNWNMKPGKIDEVRQLTDLGPTVLDRLGIEVPNPFVGQSLLRRFGDRSPTAHFSTANGGAAAGLRRGKWKYWVRFESGTEYLFDVSRDREEKKNLAGDPKNSALMSEFFGDVRGVWGEMNALIEENRIWSWKYWPKSQ